MLLFDRENCQGNSVAFPRGAEAGERFRLGDYAFRNKTRSIQVAYLGGPFESYLGPVEAAPQAMTAAAPAAATEAQGTAALPAASAATTATATASTSTGTATASSTAGSGASAAGLQSSPSSQAAQPAATTPITQPPPQPAAQAPAQAVQPAQPAPAAAPEQSAAAATQPPPAPVSPGSRRFQFPVHDEYRLNFCLTSGKDCGQPAAKAWCETQGFNRVTSWQKESHTGALFPTIVLGEERVCARYLCDGFKEIVCGS